MVLGQEFGNNAGKSPIIVRALYGQKSVRASFRAHLAQCMQELGCHSCDADPDKLRYYSHVSCYVDDI